ncbi:hypothetical protein DFH29DRAFT_912445 [Suillus ampliporus]|nr:hypothetical protein DFH29DRAFT_912445 [Suillus ampliporus]
MTTAPSQTTPSSPAHLVIPPVLHSPPSLSNIKDHCFSTGNLCAPMPGLESSASSVTNLDLNDGILVHDIDPEVDTTHSEDTTAVGQIDDVADEESRKNLRDHLRRTLSVQRGKSDAKRTIDDFPELSSISPDTTLEGYRPREYFVLTDAGKPVFAR